MALALGHGTVALIRALRARNWDDEDYRNAGLDAAFVRSYRGLLLLVGVKGGLVAILAAATWQFGQSAGYF
jgi:hypothetical protein